MAEEKSGSRAVTCDNCGYEFPHQPGTPTNPELAGASCPRCGSKSKTHGVHLTTTATGTPTMSKTVGKRLRTTSKGVASLSWVHTGERMREYWEKHPGWLGVTGVLVLGSPFLGLFGIVGWWGVIVGEAAGLLSFGAGLKALTKVRERTRGEIARGGDQ